MRWKQVYRHNGYTRKDSRWIPIDENLPPVDTLVLLKGLCFHSDEGKQFSYPINALAIDGKAFANTALTNEFYWTHWLEI
jgi:hypothetical protein